MKYKIFNGKKWVRFATLEAARIAASKVFDKTKIIVSIVKV